MRWILVNIVKYVQNTFSEVICGIVYEVTLHFFPIQEDLQKMALNIVTLIRSTLGDGK